MTDDGFKRILAAILSDDVEILQPAYGCQWRRPCPHLHRLLHCNRRFCPAIQGLFCEYL